MLVSFLNPSRVNASWHMVGVGDFGGPSHNDILWQHSQGWVSVWHMQGTNRVGGGLIYTTPVDPNWHIMGTGDFNGDGQTDILWQHSQGWVSVWFMQLVQSQLWLLGSPAERGDPNSDCSAMS